jgi:hypothetical protein
VWEPDSWADHAGVPDGCDLIVSHLEMTKTAAELRPSFEEGYARDLASDRPE